jgi:hypothetical protein
VLQPTSVNRHTRLVQFQQRLLKLMVPALALVICTMIVPPRATEASYTSPHWAGVSITVQTTIASAGRTATIVYRFSPKFGGLAVRDVHVGFDGWQNPQVVPATVLQYDLGGVAYGVTVSVPAGARVIDYAFTDGTRWDNNNGADYHAVLAPWTPAWAGNLAPRSATVAPGATIDIGAQVYQPGVTDVLSGSNFNDDLIAELWYSTGGSWQAAPMRFVRRDGNNHAYAAQLATAGLPVGTTIRYTCRFSANNRATWRWCDSGDGTIIVR